MALRKGCLIKVPHVLLQRYHPSNLGIHNIFISLLYYQSHCQDTFVSSCYMSGAKVILRSILQYLYNINLCMLMLIFIVILYSINILGTSSIVQIRTFAPTLMQMSPCISHFFLHIYLSIYRIISAFLSTIQYTHLSYNSKVFFRLFTMQPCRIIPLTKFVQ